MVVLNGPDDGTASLVEGFRRSHPDIELRIVRLPWAGASAARNAGMVAGRRRHLTFVDADDRVTPGYLEGLLRHAGPGVVPVAHVTDVDEEDATTRPGYISRVLAKLEGRQVPLREVPVVASFNAAKLLPAEVARHVRYDEALRSGEDVVFMTKVLAALDPTIHVLGPDDGVDYLRTVRPRSVSRQGATFDFNVVQRLDVVERLSTMRPSPRASLEGFVGAKLASQLGFVNRYLLEHPEAHGEVVDEIDRRAISGLPHAVMNRGLADDLVVGYAFPPTSDTSAIVAGKRVRQLGRPADVVRNPMEGIRSEDPSLRHISGPFTADELVIATRASFMTWETMEEFALEGLDRILAQRTAPYRRIYSRAHFAASHVLAAMYKVRHPETEWIAEFSDPLSRDIFGEVRTTTMQDARSIGPVETAMRERGFGGLRSDNPLEWAEWMAHGLADRIIFTNENQRDYMLSYVPDRGLATRAAEVGDIRPHPTLPFPFYSMVESRYRLDDTVANLAYFGNFYATRGLDDVLLALRDVAVLVDDAICLHVFTANVQEMQAAAEEAGVGHLVRVRAYVPFLEFLNLTTRFDALVVNDAETTGGHAANPYLPSKWSDYRGSGTGVWGVVEPGSPLSRQALTWQSRLSDHAGAVAVLQEIVSAVDRGRAAPVG